MNSIENENVKEKYEVNGGTELEHVGTKMNHTSPKRKVTFCDVVKRNITTNAGNHLLVTKRKN